jgi:hypothetical protein
MGLISPEEVSQVVVAIVAHSQTMGVLGHLRQGVSHDHVDRELTMADGGPRMRIMWCSSRAKVEPMVMEGKLKT